VNALARVCVAAVAVIVLGWLAVMERDTRLQARASAAVRPGASAAQLASAASDLRAARLLNPDAQPEIDLALVYRARGDIDRAVATIEDVVAREPDNLVAWGVLAVLARGHDPAATARALAARERLDPLNARRARQAPR
jgi:Tfp pilus assembly protein PilF